MGTTAAYWQAIAAYAFNLLRKSGLSVERASEETAKAVGVKPARVIEISKRIGKRTAPTKVMGAYENLRKLYPQADGLVLLQVLRLILPLGLGPDAKPIRFF